MTVFAVTPKKQTFQKGENIIDLRPLHHQPSNQTPNLQKNHTHPMSNLPRCFRNHISWRKLHPPRRIQNRYRTHLPICPWPYRPNPRTSQTTHTKIWKITKKTPTITVAGLLLKPHTHIIWNSYDMTPQAKGKSRDYHHRQLQRRHGKINHRN